MLFQLRAHNPSESITNSSASSSQTSSTEHSTQQQHPQAHPLFSYVGPLTTTTPPTSSSIHQIKCSTSSESLSNKHHQSHYNSGPPPSSATSGSSNQSIFNSTSSVLGENSFNLIPDYINSHTLPSPLQTTPALTPPVAARKDDTLADNMGNVTSINQVQDAPPLLISTLNLPPSSCSSSTASSSSSALDHSPGSISVNSILTSKPTTSTASPALMWPVTHPTEFNDPFRAYQPQQKQTYIQPQQPSSSSSSSSPTHRQRIPPLLQPQPRSQPGQMLIDPSSDLVFGHHPPPTELSGHDFVPSPPSPSGLIAHHHFHQFNNNQQPLYQHPYNRHSSITSTIDHPSFNTSVQLHSFPLSNHTHQPHPLNAWNGTADLGHPTTFYDPFQIKHRRRTTPAQLGILEAQFQSNCKPDVALRKQLADRLDMTPREVQVWFQNRRAKTKKLEKRAEQESGKGAESEANGNASRLGASPPASVYLSPPSMQPLALPVVMNENPDQLRIGVSPSSLNSSATHTINENEEGEEGLQYRFDTNNDRRYRSHSLHHHPYHLPFPSIFHGQASDVLTPLAIANNTLCQQQQQQRFSGPNSDSSSFIGRRSSHTSIASSTPTAADSNLIRTPTTTEFGTEDGTGGLPIGFDPRRRSSCPAEFIQSFDHFRLANGHLTDVTNAQMGLDQQSFTSTDQNGDQLPSKQSQDYNPSAPFTILEDPNGGWNGQADSWKTESTREGIQRRHSLATMGSPMEMQEFPTSLPTPTEQMHPSHHSFSSLFSWGSTAYPPKLMTPFESNPSPTVLVNSANVSNGSRSGGYARRASTSVLKSIEEHPGNNTWN
ncbi:hypothetical protein H4Q26_004184 [Puccinia striiformis f. sp. tritici PST-130]|uniref:Homeobox domain-containing protein n=1 Tax=Puccinia striiformis TaxID=27350 RepID=A0A2S4W7K2_9BASI|nr:hypothetical protein Pst134EB_023529 [Puccinia striiformis f. sp. tritici]KAI9605815.1 hypothetical protein H4Q26_004184 [Puccinia striiformis f. sp. tritici PST-130]POW17736.1 hypothetical protein PSTT_00426 [Puccinia striiformis]